MILLFTVHCHVQLYFSNHLVFVVVEGNKEPTETSKQPIRTLYLGHLTGYQPIRDQDFLIRSVPATHVLSELFTSSYLSLSISLRFKPHKREEIESPILTIY
eukprot:sb/3478310/